MQNRELLNSIWSSNYNIVLLENCMLTYFLDNNYVLKNKNRIPKFKCHIML